MQDIDGEATLRLKDGRRLGYAEYGPPDGRPVILCHGLPGSRRQHPPDLEHLEPLGVRLIVPERPGLGYSDARPARQLLDWPDDLAQLAEHLGLKRFALIGVSGGAPYALACAWCASRSPADSTTAETPPHPLTGLIAGLGIVSGMGPPTQDKHDESTKSGGLAAMPLRSRLVLALAYRAPWFLWPLLTLVGRWARVPRHAPAALTGVLFGLGGHTLAPADRTLLARSAIAAQMRTDLAEAFRQGAGGVIDDLALLSRPWGFRLEEITVPVWCWHGEADGIVPVAMGRNLAASLPNARASFIPEAGHFLVYGQWQEILAAVLDCRG